MTEPEGNQAPEIKEKDPAYRKKAQWFGLAAIGLLCFTLILSVFVGGGKRGSRDKEILPIDQQQKQPQADSQQALQERIRQERERRQRKIDSRKNLPQTADARMQAIMDRQKEQEAQKAKEQAAAGRNDRASIAEEFRLQEQRRALNARRSKFGLRPQNNQGKITPVAYVPQPDQDIKNDNALEQEKSRVRQQIQRLEQMQQGRAKSMSLSQMAGASSPSPAGSNEQAPDEEITVGRPSSEARPRPGQKLVATGTIIGAVLDQELMSDYTGPFRAVVSHDVYDVSGRYIIMPKGSRITGRSVRISNVNEPIQARMGLTVRWLVLPDGKRISFERKAAALDRAGVPAIKDKVNYHFLAQFLGVCAYAVLSSETSREGSGYSNDQTFEGSMGQSMREQFAPLAAKYLNLVPTITLRIGTPLKIFLEDDIYAYPWASLGRKLYQANRTSD